jgi:heme exporter protein B
MRKALYIFFRDVRIESRTKELLNSMLLFSFLVLLVFSIAFADLMLSGNSAAIASGVLWIGFIFAGSLGFFRAFAPESRNGTMQALRLCPVSPASIYLAKVLFTVTLMLAVEIITTVLFTVLFNFNVFSPAFAVTVVAGTIGFAATGVLLAALVQNVRAKELMLPVLLLPLVIPVLIPAVSATTAIFTGSGDIVVYLRLLFVYDIAFLAASSLLFGYIIEE